MGRFAIDDFLPVLIFLGPMYGGAAILIRETARHLGAGWPTIVLLAAAFGVLQAGLVDQSLFNPDYLDDTQYADTRAAAEATLVPGLEFSLRQAFDYVGNHIVLTICAPIVLIESFLGPQRRLRPWLGRPRSRRGGRALPARQPVDLLRQWPEGLPGQPAPTGLRRRGGRRPRRGSPAAPLASPPPAPGPFGHRTRSGWVCLSSSSESAAT